MEVARPVNPLQAVAPLVVAVERATLSPRALQVLLGTEAASVPPARVHQVAPLVSVVACWL